MIFHYEKTKIPGQTVETVLFIGRVSAFFHHSLHAQSGREVAKMKSAPSSCHCARFPLYFQNTGGKPGNGKSENFVFALPLRSPFTIFASDTKRQDGPEIENAFLRVFAVRYLLT